MLLIGSETMSRIVDWEDRGTAILFGDGAGAIVLERGDGPGRVLGFDLGSDGTLRHILHAEVGGPIEMDGQDVFRRAVRIMVDSAERALEQAGIGVDDVALFATLRSAGGRTGFVRAPDLLQVRMYSGFGATVTGWRRNFAAILGGDRTRTAAACATLLAPVGAMFALVTATATGAAVESAGVAAYALGTAASLANRASGGQRRITALLWPVECSLAAATILLARRDRRRGRLTSWKGRTIEL